MRYTLSIVVAESAREDSIDPSDLLDRGHELAVQLRDELESYGVNVTIDEDDISVEPTKA